MTSRRTAWVRHRLETSIAASAIAFFCTVAAAEDPPPPVRIPPKLSTWSVGVSQAGFRGVFPIALANDGTFTESAVHNWASRSRMKPAAAKLADEGARAVAFDSARTTINGFRFSNPDEGTEVNDAGFIRVRMVHADRAIEVGFDPQQPQRIGLGPPLAELLRVYRPVFYPPETNGRGIGFSIGGIPKGPLETEPHRIIPPLLRDWAWLELGVTTGRQDVQMLVGQGGRGDGKLTVTRFDATGESIEKRIVGDANYDVVNPFYVCAETIINQFELRDRAGAAPRKAAAHCYVGICSALREVRVEFDLTQDTPAEWKQRLSAAIAAVRKKTSDVDELPSTAP